MSIFRSKTDGQDSEIVKGGIAAGSAFLAAMWLDNKLSSWRFNDIKLVGQMFTTRTPLWQIQGVAGHYAFSTMMAFVYVRYARQRLPGPSWLRGILFLMAENTVLYPAGLIVDRIHAGMKSGQLALLLDRKTFFGQITRHVAFGIALGLVCGRET